VSTFGTNDARHGCFIVLHADLVGMHACTVYHNFCLHCILFLLDLIKKNSPGYLASLGVLGEGLEVHIVGQSRSLHPRYEALDGGSEERVEVHPSVHHLRLMQDRAPLVMDLCHVWEGFPYLMPTNDLGAVDAALVVGAHQLPQVDQMVEQGAWEVHENGLQERGRNTQLQLLVLIGSCEQEVVTLM